MLFKDYQVKFTVTVDEKTMKKLKKLLDFYSDKKQLIYFVEKIFPQKTDE